ncbi:TasA family protein [Cellulomonas dongxiuzhuiae]|uniref:Camelysin metallo-endopeptidase n=1 Tax=Cellulomonas dongxiuzhuiae TaxID=2819979 RepID=A0ABX8GGZ6_9CELL|nr:TasA family protein [Cellulomonas dongxiuzhuiae]MBO3094368.1 hypothetical protein [Cellulomonas dongxiuzhuiae]QWC15402.1 hypothetical protein KKR89_13980 [Cellulomonas dongxiuzhuiae]
MMDELLEDMIDPAPSRQEVARRRRGWATGSILVLAAVGVTSLTTSALFTDQDSLTGTISTGTVVLTADGAQFTMPVGGLAPGGAVVAPLTVDNVGSLELRYAVSVSAATTTPATGTAGSGDLRTQLRARVLQDAVCTLDSSAAATVLGDTQDLVDSEFGLPSALTAIVGDPATGAQTGDRVLAGVTGTETLCVRVDMSRDSDNTFQNTAAELTFQLDSEQTVNN